MHFSEYDTRLAAYAVITDGGRVLLSWFNGSTPGWTLPGGEVEFGGTTDRADWIELAALDDAGPRTPIVDVGLATLGRG